MLARATFVAFLLCHCIRFSIAIEFFTISSCVRPLVRHHVRSRERVPRRSHERCSAGREVPYPGTGVAMVAQRPRPPIILHLRTLSDLASFHATATIMAHLDHGFRADDIRQQIAEHDGGASPPGTGCSQQIQQRMSCSHPTTPVTAQICFRLIPPLESEYGSGTHARSQFSGHRRAGVASLKWLEAILTAAIIVAKDWKRSTETSLRLRRKNGRSDMKRTEASASHPVMSKLPCERPTALPLCTQNIGSNLWSSPEFFNTPSND